MPINGPAGYIPTLSVFLPHWAAVDSALPPGSPLVLAGGLSQAGLSDLRDALETERGTVRNYRIDRVIARGNLTRRVIALQARAVEFNGRLRADFPGSIFARSLPLAFGPKDGEGNVNDKLRHVSKLWARVDAILPAPAGVTLPLELHGNYSRTMFESDRAALADAYGALADAEVELLLARASRDVLQERIYEDLKTYRIKVPTALPPGHTLVQKMPQLNPHPGHTPKAVKAEGSWDAATGKAKVTWEASEEADLKHYEVCGEPGESYLAEDETSLAVVPPDAPREVLSDLGLASPGLTAAFKVYVVLNTDRQKGSQAVYVTRPG